MIIVFTKLEDMVMWSNHISLHFLIKARSFFASGQTVRNITTQCDYYVIPFILSLSIRLFLCARINTLPFQALYLEIKYLVNELNEIRMDSSNVLVI